MLEQTKAPMPGLLSALKIASLRIHCAALQAERVPKLNVRLNPRVEWMLAGYAERS
jgi:hypothetical protein